jgi:hypothetical protein
MDRGDGQLCAAEAEESVAFSTQQSAFSQRDIAADQEQVAANRANEHESKHSNEQHFGTQQSAKATGNWPKSLLAIPENIRPGKLLF